MRLSYTKNIPRYAILSHTWGTDADEVTFQEMLIDPDDRPPSTTSKAGYQKILKTCEIAQRYNTNHEGRFYYQDRLYYVDQHIEHVWIDTCCIDKSSSAELSEAINSMYKYYLEADVCFAYLSDMTADLETFETSRWFTRGWTLQELVAPKRINFYDGSWTCRGDRDSLQDVIRRVTRISTFKNITELPVAVRMSWAAQRETTRDEDLAYCLMGIFDVNMPLLYGEGRKAFIRLQEEIIKQNPDLSIFAWTDSFPSMFSGLLAESPEWFRDGEDLQAAANIDTVYREFSVTNQGIRFQFPLKYHNQTGCLVLPLGHQSKSQQYPLGVFLRQISNDFCVRASPDTMADEDLCHRAEETIIQVPKVLSNKEIRDLRQTGITFPEEFNRLRSRGLLIGELAPLGCWDPDTKTVHAGHKGIFECLLVFEMDQRCRVWNQQMGPSWSSFGVIFKYEARQEYNRRWLYKVVDTDNSIFFEKDARYILKQFRRHGDYTNGLEEELVVPGGLYVEGLLGMQQLSLRLVPLDYTIGAEWRSQSEDPQIYKGRRVGLAFKWRPIRELSGEHDQRPQ
ncbi:hypothetical protein SLS60_001455 [Paraconiothyrium brasiliense]|uniref:Heterokaryon incompatibility domain-containing protein n=1 Tax=Paraconiothyrium brasiliense TaxID=300254 RepID=A0ABR3S948_9PLEO